MILLASLDWIALGLGCLVGAAFGFGLKLLLERSSRRRIEAELSAREERARCESEQVRQQAKAEAAATVSKLREEAETEAARRRQEMDSTANRLSERENLLNRHLEGMVEKERLLQQQHADLAQRREQFEAQESELRRLKSKLQQERETVAGLTADEARAQLMRDVEQEARKDANDLTRHMLENARLSADREARRITATAIQRYAGAQTYELTTASVSLNGASDIKGRIIGRDGRNIRAFETATGVTVLIDDTPNTVVLSGFDPVRREVARRSMEMLIADGRIHPTRIEEVVEQISSEVDETIREAAENAVHELGLPPLHEETLLLLGRLRFRRSFSQNILHHSIEVAQLAGLMASELEANVPLARRAGLLHDIGKGLNHEVEGSHALIGADFLKRHGECDEVVNAVAAHHDEVPPEGVIAFLVSAADALSASRPGARSESMTNYLRRLESLERIGASFDGVDKCYAVQAGRELRVIVQPDKLEDDAVNQLARQLARKIETDLQYPGQIRVTVLRETRCVVFAK